VINTAIAIYSAVQKFDSMQGMLPIKVTLLVEEYDASTNQKK
jgi:hypothetical protein